MLNKLFLYSSVILLLSSVSLGLLLKLKTTENSALKQEIEHREVIVANSNLSDLTNTATARTNLNVYSKTETYTKTEVDGKTTIASAAQAQAWSSNTGASASQYITNNLIIGDPATTGFSTSNKGVGNMQPIGDGGAWWLQYENSDPTSVSYGQSLGANFRNSSGSPSAGKWLSGMRVTERSPSVSGTAGSQYIVLGYARATTGTGNVAGTDWIPMRCLTGT